MNRWLQGVLVLGWIPTLLVAGGVRWFAPEPAAAQERTPIKVTRIYTGEDGKTHAEELEVPLGPGNRATTELSEPVPVTSVQFRRNSPAYYIDWHTAPRRQYVITLQGQVEIGLGDGTKRIFNVGDIELCEDLTGRGHTTRSVGDVDRISVQIPLADQTSGGGLGV